MFLEAFGLFRCHLHRLCVVQTLDLFYFHAVCPSLLLCCSLICSIERRLRKGAITALEKEDSALKLLIRLSLSSCSHHVGDEGTAQPHLLHLSKEFPP